MCISRCLSAIAVGTAVSHVIVVGTMVRVLPEKKLACIPTSPYGVVAADNAVIVCLARALENETSPASRKPLLGTIIFSVNVLEVLFVSVNGNWKLGEFLGAGF